MEVKLEYFKKTDHDREIDRLCGYTPLTIYDQITRTYHKYMWKYGTTDITIKTNEVKPQIYKVGAENINIEKL